MTVDTSLTNTSNTLTGIVLVVFRDPDVPSDSLTVIERSLDGNTWEEVGTITNCDPAGTEFIDYLPLTGTIYYYRSKHTHPEYEDSAYVFEVTGSAGIIPDINFITKPWLLNQSPLQLVMVVTGSDNTQWYIEPEVNQPVIGTSSTPVVTAFASGNVGTVSAGSTANSFRVARPAGSASFEQSYITFTSTLTGYTSGFDRVDLSPLGFDTNNLLSLIVNESSSNANTLGIECSVINPNNYPIDISVSQSNNVGTITKDANNRFTIARPATGIGSVLFQVTSSNASAISDYDTVFVEADTSLDPNQFLELVLTVTSSTLTTLGVSASCDTAFPVGFGVVSSNNVGAVTQNAASQWTITRPSAGEGSVTFIVTSSDATVVSDVDTVYVPKDPAPYLTVRSEVTATDITSVTASVDIFDSNNQDTNLSGITISVVSQSLAGFTAVQYGTGTQTPGKDSYVYHITRPNYNQGTGRVTFVATKTGYTSDSDSVEVPERVDELAKLRTIIVPVGSDSASITVNVSVLDALPQAGVYINLSQTNIGIPSITPSTSAYLSASEARQYVIARPNFGSGTGRVNFTATASLRVNDTDAVDVPERSINTTSPAIATITIGTVTSGSDNITIPYSFDTISTAEQVQVFVQESSGSAPTIASVEFTGTRTGASPLYRNDGRSQFIIPIAQPSNYVLVTFVPFDTLNRRGTIFTNRYQALSAPLTPPDAFTSVANIASGSTFVSNSVGIPASNLPDKIRPYLFGSPYGSDIVRTAGASTTQTIIHSGLNPDSLYEWQYYPVNNNGAVGDPTTTLVTETTAGPALPTPVYTYSAQESGGVWYVYFYINNDFEYPGNVTFTGEVTDSSFVLDGYTSEQSQFTHFWLASFNDLGYVRFKASAPGYTDSAFGSYVSWYAGSGSPF